jgi:hypothetical protein
MVNLVFALGYLLILLGLIGAVVPVLPGPFLIWLGALVWAWGDGFQRIGWPTLMILLLLALLAWGSDLILNLVIGRRAGTSWKAFIAAIVGGIGGGLLLSGIAPVIGSLVGAALGALAGVFAVEWWDKRDRRAAWAAVRAYTGSMILAAIVEIVIAVAMVSLFAWQAFL